MDQSQNIQPSTILAIPEQGGKAIRKRQVAALTLVREMREMFIAISAHGTPLPSSSDTEFFAVEHEGRMMRFFFNGDGDILVSLERPTRGLFLQMPNLKDMNPRDLTEDEISTELHASFALLDGTIENSRLVEWYPNGASPTFPDIESCELEDVPGLRGLISGTLKFAMAAIRRELPTIYARMTNKGQTQRPHLSLDSDPDTEELSTLINCDDVPHHLFEVPIHANRFVLPQMFGITALAEDHLRICRIPTVRFCPNLAYNGSVEELDRTYDLMGAAMPLAPRTSIEARQCDLDLSVELHMNEDFDTIFDAMDFVEAGDIHGAPMDADDLEAHILHTAFKAPPVDAATLAITICEFAMLHITQGGKPTEVLLAAPEEARVRYFTGLAMGAALAVEVEGGADIDSINFASLVDSERLEDQLSQVRARRLNLDTRLVVTDGLRAQEMLDAYITRQAHEMESDPEAYLAKLVERVASEDAATDPRASVERIDEALVNFADLGDGPSPEALVENIVGSLFSGDAKAAAEGAERIPEAHGPPQNTDELVDRLGVFFEKVDQSGLAASEFLKKLHPDSRFNVYLCLKVAKNLAAHLQAETVPEPLMFRDLISSEDITLAMVKMSLGSFDEEVSQTIIDGAAAYPLLVDFLDKDDLANVEPAGNA